MFPLVLSLVCAGWGLMCRSLFGLQVDGALVVALGFAAVIVAAGLLTASPVTAPGTVVVIAVVAVAGLVRHRNEIRPDRWPTAVAVAVMLAFGAPILLSGHATFAGYIRLDDTASWLGVVDRVMSHSRSLAGLPPSTYALNLHSYLFGMGYPIGSFLPLGVGRALVGVDAAWVFQPYLAFCGMLIGLSVFSFSRRLIDDVRLRAMVAFVAAQPALLYGYSLWGAIKEVAAAALLALLVVLVAQAIEDGRERRRTLGGLAIASAAFGVTLGPGAVVWLGPALGLVVGTWLWRARRAPGLRLAIVDGGLMGALIATLMLPVWLELGAFISGSTPLFSNAGGASSTMGEGGLVSLLQPLSVFQLGGIWPVGDFRTTAQTALTAPLLAAVALGIVISAAIAVRRRQPSLIVYPALALLGCLLVWLGGSNPWVVGKALAIASPALLVMGLTGAAMLRSRSAALAVALTVVISGGVLWSNALAYHDVQLAPAARLGELQRLAPMVAGNGPTLINEYEIYADRHFLRDGAPTEPAEYRPDAIPLLNGSLLTQSAQADLDSFSFETLLAYPSIVTRTSPVASRPPSSYSLRWQGRYYQLWQRARNPAGRILAHVPLGDTTRFPFCGQSTTGYLARCSIQPAAVPPCAEIDRLGAIARSDGANLVAYQRPAPIVARGDQTQWPAPWLHDPAAGTLTPTSPGRLDAHIAVDSAQRYELWLGGSFARGFYVGVDGRELGRVENELANIGQYIAVGGLRLSPGVHTITLDYPSADLSPGSGADTTILSEIVLQPMDTPATRMITVDPSAARTLCGRSLDWVEIVAPHRG